MQTCKCMVVEDEPLAADVLHDYIAAVPFLQLTSTHADAISAGNALHANAVDVIFLDIQLPALQGLDFIATLVNPPQIIITTAFHQFALQGYAHNVLDYLLKPIAFGRFLQAVHKLRHKKAPAPIMPGSDDDDYVLLQDNHRKHKIYFREILFIESMKEYVKITTTAKSIVIKIPLCQLETMLPADAFLRVHRSFIVARNKIESYSATEIEINNMVLPIGRTYRDVLAHLPGQAGL